MAKIDTVLGRTRLTTRQKKVLEHLENHEDEVFSYADAISELNPRLDLRSADWALLELWQKGLIDREKIGRRLYYGTKKAIATVRERLGKSKKIA